MTSLRVVLVILLGGCSDAADPGACTILCSDRGDCPSAMTCASDGYCHAGDDGAECVAPEPDPPDPPDAASPPDTAVPMPDAPVPCASGELNEVEPTNGHCYMFFTAAISWAAARSSCEALGAHLVTLTDGAEGDFVRAKFVGTRTVWLGASDSLSESGWRWVSDEPWAYTAWAYGQPDDDDYNQDCATMMGLAGPVWDDYYCTMGKPYICERE